MTTVAEKKVVSMNYTLKDDAGNILDSSEGQPLEYLQGFQNIIPGLEKALNGLNVGDKKQVTIAPEEAYGQYNEEMKFQLPKEQFGGEAPEPEMMVQLNSTNGESFVARIVGVEGDMVNLDANHPLAGKTLHFDVEITDVREASAEELQHGHPHGPGGHHH